MSEEKGYPNENSDRNSEDSCVKIEEIENENLNQVDPKITAESPKKRKPKQPAAWRLVADIVPEYANFSLKDIKIETRRELVEMTARVFNLKSF